MKDLLFQQNTFATIMMLILVIAAYLNKEDDNDR